MQLITLRCPACGTTLKIDSGEAQFKCEYCQNTINVIKPLSSSGLVEGLSEMEQGKYDNYLSILEQSMLAGNYSEGYNYCNKGLEINPKSPELWANKAICSLWISTFAQLSEEKALEIITYLNACKQNDPDLKIYDSTAKSIAENLYFCALYKYNLTQPDTKYSSGNIGYSEVAQKNVLICIKLIELCNEIYPDINYIIQALRLINLGKIRWIYNNVNTSMSLIQGFDAIKKAEKLRDKIKQFYTPEKLEENAKSDYKSFCSFASEYLNIDSRFYNENLLPLINKFKPAKLPLSPDLIKKKRRNKILAFIIISTVILLPIALFIILANIKTDKELPVYTKRIIEEKDSIKNLRKQYDRDYLISEFEKTDDNSVFAQKILVIILREDKSKGKARQIADFYRDYYREWAIVNFSNRLRLQMWFYTDSLPPTFNPDVASTEYKAKYDKYLYGTLFFNYDDESYKGSLY